ncbi:MAG TPA: thioesterase family protein [Chitinophagales bacterium]|nr:thioesterase family protein [Chitinophagales bacterium]
MENLPITYRGVVYPWYCDHMGHMNIMWYAGKFDEATWNLVHLFGGTPPYMKTENRGFVAAEQRIAYRKELLAGNIVYIRSGVIEIKDKVFRFFHEMFSQDTNEIAAITWLTGVHIDSQTRRAISIPAEMKKAAETYITAYQPA